VNVTLLRDPKAVCELSQAQDFSFERHILWKQFGVVSADVHGVIQHAAPSEPIQQRAYVSLARLVRSFAAERGEACAEGLLTFVGRIRAT